MDKVASKEKWAVACLPLLRHRDSPLGDGRPRSPHLRADAGQEHARGGVTAVQSPRRVIKPLGLGRRHPYGSRMTDANERALQAAIDGEMQLLDPRVRASPTRVLELLDPQFTETGASGRRWDAESILTVTSGGSISPESPVQVSDMTGVVLAPGVVHLTYFADNQGRRAWRSSLWRLTATGWRMYYHQATLAA
jgi:hypothetical protein